MTSYLDASVLVPLVVQEPGSLVVRRWFADHGVGSAVSSRWAVVEFTSAIGNRVRRGDLTTVQGEAALAGFERDLVAELELVDAEPRDLEDFARRAIAHFERGLRGGDALHVAIALRIDATILLTLDRRLASAARAFGLDAAGPA